jgi:molybdate transport system ATP-binding protein
VDDIRMHPSTKYAADLAGTNLIVGTASGDTVTVGSHTLHVPATERAGSVMVTFHPRAVALHLGRPDGSPRNVWRTTIDRIDDLDSIVRVRTGPPLPVIAEVTKGAAESLALGPGMAIWVSVKATELTVAQSE